MICTLFPVFLAYTYDARDDISRHLTAYYENVFAIKCKIRIDYGGDIKKIVDDAKQNNKSIQISQGIKIEWVQSGNRIIWSKLMDIDQRPRKGFFENGQYKKTQIGGTKEQVHFNSLVVDVANVEDVIFDDELSPWMFTGFIVGGKKKQFLSRLLASRDLIVSLDQSGQTTIATFALDDSNYKIELMPRMGTCQKQS